MADLFGSILGAVAGPLVSGLFADDAREDAQAANASSRAEDYAFAREQQNQNIALQREFAQMGIRWRVEDAKAAGLHPMYALTGGGAAFAPNPVVMPGSGQSVPSGGGSSYGSALQGALAAFFASQEKKDAVIAQAVNSVAQVAQSFAISSVPAPSDYRWDVEGSGGPMHSPVNLSNLVDVQSYTPAPVLSRRSEESSLTPGTGPAFSEHQIAPGFAMALPSSSSGGTSEALESVSESWQLMHAVIEKNVALYGEGWLDQASRYFPVSSLAYRVIRNIQNAGSYVEPVWDALGHRVRDAKLRMYEEERSRGAESARHRDALRNRGRNRVQRYRKGEVFP